MCRRFRFAADWVNGHATLDYAVSDVKQMDKGWQVEVAKMGTAKYPVMVEAETKSGKKLRQRINRMRATNRLRFATKEDLRSVVIDPDTSCPDLDRSNNHWTKGN